MMQGAMRLVGGTGKKITDEAIRTDNWKIIEETFTPLDLINVLEGFKLTKERREWVRKLLAKRLEERAQKVEGDGCWSCGKDKFHRPGEHKSDGFITKRTDYWICDYCGEVNIG
jgi:hypothetical protein